LTTHAADAQPRHRHHYRAEAGNSNLQGFIAGCSDPLCEMFSVLPRSSVPRRLASRRQEANRAHRRLPPDLRRVMAEGAGRVVAHPRGCPRRAFCGCGAAVRMFDRPIRSLWLARNWLRFPSVAPASGSSCRETSPCIRARAPDKRIDVARI
jgi:hypothetical protein